MKRTKSVAICLKLLQYVYLERTFLLEVVVQNSIAIGLYREITFGVGKKTPVATE